VSGCDRGEQRRTMPDEKFHQIYGDILFLGELHRGDSTGMRLALDSLLTANDIDTAILFASAREIALDKERSEELHRIVIERFEKIAAPADTAAAAPRRAPALK
jgi:hypothetical protein